MRNRMRTSGFTLAVAAGVAALLILSAACQDARRSPRGFSLPGGDPAQGLQAFLELKCNTCHQVEGMELPGPVADPRVPVALGGQIHYAKTDGDLVTSIINPSHRIAAGYDKALVQSGDMSRMGDYADVMTVRQMIDVVAFLQARYKIAPPPQPGP